MPYKLCPNCSQSSYSASDRGVWDCPYCGKDITFVQSTAEFCKNGNNISKKQEKQKGHLRLV